VLVVDASVIVEVTLQRLETEAMKALGEDELVAPWLLWSEVPSALNELAYRSDIPTDIGEKATERFKTVAVKPRHPDDLIDEARRIAKAFLRREIHKTLHGLTDRQQRRFDRDFADLRRIHTEALPQWERDGGPSVFVR